MTTRPAIWVDSGVKAAENVKLMHIKQHFLAHVSDAAAAAMKSRSTYQAICHEADEVDLVTVNTQLSHSFSSANGMGRITRSETGNPGYHSGYLIPGDKNGKPAQRGWNT